MHRQDLPQLPGHRREEVRLAAGRAAQDRQEQRLHLEHRPRDGQVAMRAGQAPAGHPPGVDRVAVDGEPAGQEPLLPLGTEHRVAQQLDVLGDPQHLLGSERLPAMRARRPRQQPDRLGLRGYPRLLVHHAHRRSPAGTRAARIRPRDIAIVHQRPTARRIRSASTHAPASEQDDERPRQTDSGADPVPTIGTNPLGHPEPADRRGDIDAAVRRIRPARVRGVDPRERRPRTRRAPGFPGSARAGSDPAEATPRRRNSRRSPRAPPRHTTGTRPPSKSPQRRDWSPRRGYTSRIAGQKHPGMPVRVNFARGPRLNPAMNSPRR